MPRLLQDEKHPFLLESLYRMVAQETTGGDLSNPDAVLVPLMSSVTRTDPGGSV